MRSKGYSVSVIGLGYVGVVTAACLAYRGIDTFCFDIDESKRSKVSLGESPIYEPGIEELLREAIREGRLKVVNTLHDAVTNSAFSFLTVGTPQGVDGSADLSFIKSALVGIGEALRKSSHYHVVVIKSTIPPGTSINVIKPILEESSGKVCGEGFGICVNPEFLREGNAINDTFEPDRIVIGGVDDKSSEMLLRLYERFYNNALPPTLITNALNAEIIKYASNAFLAMKVSFINMMARLCEALPGGDVDVVAKGMGLDKRISPHFLEAGIGWGGSCFPKDLRALRNKFLEHGIQPHLIDATIRTNDEQVEHVVRIIEEELNGVEGRRIAILGLAFKENTDDVRESQAIKLVKILREKGAKIAVYDPKALSNAKQVLGGGLEYHLDWMGCLEGSDAAVIATPWPELRVIDPITLRKLMKNPLIVDARRILERGRFLNSGVKLRAIGNGS